MSDSVPFPPAGPTTPANILPAYPYQEYADDDNIQAIFAAYNIIAQQYLNWFDTINLPIYTGLSGLLLDWVGTGLYGLPRPSLASGSLQFIGPLATWQLASYPIATTMSVGATQNPVTTDDIYKRIITWFFFKGDGQQFCTLWLKRRIMRFLIGTEGTAPNIDNTYPVSITFNGGGSLTITLILTDAYGISLSIAQTFQAAVKVGAVSMPFQLSEVVVIINDLGPTGLSNNGSFLQVNTTTGWPTSPAGLPPGSVWLNGPFASIVPGVTPDPFAVPQYFGQITSGSLLFQGGGNLPLSDPLVLNQLWNNGSFVVISAG